MEQFQTWIIDFLHMLFPVNVWSWAYFVGLWEQYKGYEGIFTGAIIIAIIYFSTEEEYLDEDKVRESLRVFALVAFINSLDGVYMLLMNFLNTYILNQASFINATYIQGALNPLSLMILVLIISECYSNKPRLAFFFGLSTFSISMLMFGSGHTNGVVLNYLLVRVFIASTLCAIGSKITYSFIVQLIMGLFFLVTEVTHVYLLRPDLYYGKEIADSLLTILLLYKSEMIIISVIIIVFAIYEIFILADDKLKIKDFSLAKVVISTVLFVVVSAGFVYYPQNIYIKEEQNEEGHEEEQERKVSYSYQEVDVYSAEASSFLKSSSGNIYNIDYMIDGSIESCWQDGKDTDGSGETLKCFLKKWYYWLV